MTYQTTPSPKLGGVHISLTDGVIPAHSVTHMETSCSYDGQTTPLHPFAFRTHTHSHGRVVSGYRVRGRPLEPHRFGPIRRCPRCSTQ
uniref:Cu2_monoox_C domain-containing protein n=1 Tax=Macrostomum lignano TaxID=282301 RepID=A0A1I8JRM5_9PLAT